MKVSVHVSLRRPTCPIPYANALSLPLTKRGSYLACNTRKGTFGYLFKVSSRISMHSPRRLIWDDTFRFMYFSVWSKSILAQNLMSRKVQSRISLRKLCRLIRYDTLCKYPKVPFRVLQANIIYWKRRASISARKKTLTYQTCDVDIVL